MQLTSEEIKKYEDAGINILETYGGRITYQTRKDENTCNSCSSLRLLPDPDPYDSFCDDDQKAICTENGKIISRSLNVWESSKVGIPSWCPKK